jgi:hypothetical protein
MITQARLKELLHYDPDTGVFTRVSKRKGVMFERPVGSIHVVNGKKYLRIRLDRVRYMGHRLAWLYMTGDGSPVGIDHENGNGLSNEFKNLREASQFENMKNMRLNRKNTSGVCGVSRPTIGDTWVAWIYSCGKNRYLGGYKDKFEAICARKSAEHRLGFHENHGQVRPL